MLPSPAIATPPSTSLRGRPLLAVAGVAVHVLVAAWTFAPALFDGRMLYLRDISTYFYPNLVFLGRSFAAGVFPLWNPAVDAGSPFLLVYPLDLLLVALAGPATALGAGPAAHMVIASVGTSALGRQLGLGPQAAWTCGLVFALSGFAVSTVNLVPLHQAAAWAPVVLLLAQRVAARPTAVESVLLGIALALQVSTLAGEIVMQTVLAAAILPWPRVDRKGVAALAGAAALGALLSAPAWLGIASILRGTARGEGFTAAQVLAGSLSPIELCAVVLPRFFGDMHTFTSVGFWGQAFFLNGFPYLLSTYVGASVVALAIAAGRDRLWWMVGIGLLLALGANGPFSWALGALAVARNPVKFLFLASLGLALLAGRGLDRSASRRASWIVVVPGIAVAMLGIWLSAAPGNALAALSGIPAFADPSAGHVMRTVWPQAFLASGLIALAVGVVARRGGGLGFGAAVLVILDLLLVNGDVNRFAPASFYALRDDVRAMLGGLPRDQPFRVFGYALGATPGLHFAPALLRENSDVWLYYLDRQLLFGRAPVLDGLEGALDEDRTGWAPRGSTLEPGEGVPARFSSIHTRLRRANVRWILSFAPLPEDLAAERARVALPEVLEPLRLFEVEDALPRAFFSTDPDAGLPAAGGRVDVSLRGPHDIQLNARTPPGFIVLLSGWDKGWHARGGDGTPVALRRAGDRYIAIRTDGGERTFHLRYRPGWWPASLTLAGLGVCLAAALAAAGVRRKRRAEGEEAARG